MREDMFDAVVSRANMVIPGLFSTLELYCKTRYNSSVLETLVNKPELIVDALKDLYSNMDVARFIVRELLIKPLVTTSNKRINVDELLNLLFEKPDEFKKLVAELIDPA